MPSDELHKIAIEIERLLQVQSEQVDRMRRIEIAMMGDAALGQEGFIHRQARYNEIVDEHAALIITWKSKMAGAFLAATGLGALINWFFNLHDKQ